MRFAVTLSATVSLLVIAPMVYMAADNQPPYEYDESRSYVVPSQTQSGHQLLVHWEFKKVYRVCPGSVTRFIVDQKTKTRVSYDPSPTARNIDIGDMTLNRTFYLPPETTPGSKWYYADLEFACNPLQRLYPLRVQTPRLSFEVLP